jgi:hypothetical protein
MATNADALNDLIAAKTALEDRCDGAAGETLQMLLDSIEDLADEIGALETQALSTAPYVPQTDAFKKVTDEAKAFEARLNNIKTAFSALAELAKVIDKAIGYIK